MAAAGALLEVTDLEVEFATANGVLRAADRVSFAVRAGGAVGVVGESGSGKSATAQSILRLNEGAARHRGSVRFQGREVLGMGTPELRALRGAGIAMVFQDAGAALNPALRVRDHLLEAIRVHRDRDPGKAGAEARALELMRAVGIPAPEERLRAYPHELSGGMRQRVMIAIALAGDPALLIADEPTTALDVTVQAQIVDLLLRLRRERGMALLLVTHALALVAEACDEVVVLYAGRVVERGPVREVLAAPAHPYTAGLLASAPRPGASQSDAPSRLAGIPGIVPDLRALPPGCRFQTRCPIVQEICRVEEPALIALGTTREHRCHFPAVPPLPEGGGRGEGAPR